ncbi:hypothetical protein L0P88_17985 [Muricauda sp. SCSIO 64092]|uniref:hypothetical protein n=1 Tax=Allomuricauda sp. SCSIO 64092 TaxID=2908842 RepID=UPI001FF184E8|nr:hypothetical protein [Muricauda sp. SCSIO 64092]UOY05818.1 hypothetical protein L0P88_17985 [Muricauda sp. SCSIO 64092]
MKIIKKANSCKYVTDFTIDRDIITTHIPKPGDVAIFEVLELWSIKAIQDFEGRNCYIFEEDHIMAAFGNRYASNQFEAYVPEAYQEVYDLVGKGGVVGNVASMYYKLEDIGPTKLKLVGYATDSGGKVINTIYHHRETTPFQPFKSRPFKTILSVGASMDSGKTTTAAFLCRGLKNAGNKVAYIKLTGTIFNKDKMLCLDCGADYVTDFSEMGYPSTYLCTLDEILDIHEGLLKEVAKMQFDYVVIEIADGLYQRETHKLMCHLPFTDTADHVILSCSDSLAVHTGIQMLSPIFSERLFALGGRFTGSPLMVGEVERKEKLPVLTLEKLVDGALLSKLLGDKKVQMVI